MTTQELNIIAKESLAKNGNSSTLHSLLERCSISHPNFDGFTFRESAKDKKVVITTEGKIGPQQKQEIRIPKNLLDFPLDFVMHMLAHEFIHIEQRARPGYNASREEREFEAYYHGIFPAKYNLPPCPSWLRLQFCKSVERYYESMGFWVKLRHRKMYKEVLEVKNGLLK